MLKNLFRLGHVKTSDAAVEQRVESHNVGCDVLVQCHLVEHDLVDSESFLKLVRLLVRLNHGGVDDSVHWYTVFFHSLEDFDSPIDVIVLDTGLKQTAICHCARHQSSPLHLAEDFESVFQLVLLPIRFDYDAIGDCAWLNSSHRRSETTMFEVLRVAAVEPTIHLVEKIDSSIEVSEAHTHVDHAVEEDLVGLLSELPWTVVHLFK